MQKKRYARGTINTRVAPILYFFENNDIELNKRKVKRYFPSDESVRDDRPYTVEEIVRMLSVCDLRSKAMILLMASGGLRIGALSSMQVQDLKESNYQNLRLYKVQVYARTHDKYLTLCTQVASLLSKAATEKEIAYKLGVNQSTISRDIGVLKEESQKHVYELAKESLAFFYTQSLDGINEAKRESWKIYNDEKTPTRERLLALKTIIQADERRFRLLSEGPSVLAFKTLQERLDKIESR